MEHTDLTEQQYQVLTALGDSPIPLDATALGKKLPLIEAPAQRVSLNKLFRLGLVDRTDTGKGYIYEVSAEGEALITQQAKESLVGKGDAKAEIQVEAGPALSDCGHYEVTPPREERPADLDLSTFEHRFDQTAEPLPNLDFAAGIGDVGIIGMDFAAGADTSVEFVKFPGHDEFLRAGSLEHLITELNYEPSRPDDLDARLADLQRMIEGFRPRFPDVSADLERVYRLLHDAYPDAVPESSEQAPA